MFSIAFTGRYQHPLPTLPGPPLSPPRVHLGCTLVEKIAEQPCVGGDGDGGVELRDPTVVAARIREHFSREQIDLLIVVLGSLIHEPGTALRQNPRDATLSLNRFSVGVMLPVDGATQVTRSFGPVREPGIR